MVDQRSVVFASVILLALLVGVPGGALSRVAYAQGSSPVDLPEGKGAVGSIMIQYEARLYSGTLARDARAALRAEGDLMAYYGAWADAFTVALERDPESPKRREAMWVLAGYLGGAERFAELRDLYVELAGLEASPFARSHALGLGVTAALAQAVVTGEAAEATAAMEMLESAWAFHDAAAYSGAEERSRMAAMLGGYAHELATLARAHHDRAAAGAPALDAAGLASLADLAERCVDRVEAECLEADRASLRDAGWPMGRALGDVALARAAAGDAAGLAAALDRRSALPAVERGEDDAWLFRSLHAVAARQGGESYRRAARVLLDRLGAREVVRASILNALADEVGVATGEGQELLEEAFDIASDPAARGGEAWRVIEASRAASGLFEHFRATGDDAATAHWRAVAAELTATIRRKHSESAAPSGAGPAGG